jgi:hypothetical protein
LLFDVKKPKMHIKLQKYLVAILVAPSQIDTCGHMSPLSPLLLYLKDPYYLIFVAWSLSSNRTMAWKCVRHHGYSGLTAQSTPELQGRQWPLLPAWWM